MEMSLWILAAFTGCFAVLTGFWWFWFIRQTPLQNRALIDVLQQQSDACWLTDDDGRHLWHNAKAGCPAESTCLHLQLFFSADGQHPCLPDILAMLQIDRHWQGFVWVGDTPRQAYQLQISVVSGYRRSYLLWRWHSAQAELSQLQSQIETYLDPTTELPGLALWRYWLQQQLLRHQLRYHGLALVILEINDLATVHRSFGAEAANVLLQQLVKNIQAEVPVSAFLARLGPQQLGIMLSLDGHDAQTHQQALQLTREILNFSQGPFVMPVAELSLDCRAGIAIYPDAGHNIDELHAHAQQALKIASTMPEKVYLWQMQGHSPITGIELQLELQQALTQYQLEIWSQPVINLTSGDALALRLELYWRSPTRGLLPYAELKTLAAQTGQLLAIERWAFSQICQLLALWNRLSPVPLIQFEFSTSNICHSGLLTFLENQLQAHQLKAQQFMLCLHEDGWLQDQTGFNAQAEALKNAGFHLLIADVGQGVGALKLLQQPYWHSAEISEQLVRQLEESDVQRNACASLTRLLINQGLQVQVQGVDTEMKAYLLHVMGCHSCRGQHFSKMRPVSAEQLPYGLQQEWQQAG